MKLRKYFQGLLILFFIFVVLAGSIYSHNKYQSLAYGQDTSFYLEFIARNSSASLPDQYSYIPSIGINFLGFTGSDGKQGIHKTLHLEIIKYVFSFIYLLFGKNLLAVFVFNAFVFFLPVLYIALIHPFKDYFQSILALFFSFLYFIYPSTLLALTFDLRPRNLIAPILIVSLLSIHYKRPLWEKLFFFTFLFLIREEFILFAIPIMLYQFLTNREANIRYFLAIWGVGILIIAAFINWAGFEYLPESNQLLKVFQYPRLKLPFVIGGGIALILIFYFHKISLAHDKPSILLPPFIVGLVNIPIFPELYFIIEKSLPYSGFDRPIDFFWNIILISPQPMILIFTFLLLLFILSTGLIQKQAIKVLYIIFAIIVSRYIVIQNIQHRFTLFETYGRPSKINLFPQQSEDIFSLRTESDQQETYILDDVRTHQAFYDYNYAYVFDNLPWYLVTENITDDKSLSLLEALIVEKIEYIVILKDNQAEIDETLQKLKIVPLETIESERFIIYTIK